MGWHYQISRSLSTDLGNSVCTERTGLAGLSDEPVDAPWPYRYRLLW